MKRNSKTYLVRAMKYQIAVNVFITTEGYWRDIKRRKAFFDEFASEKGFNPLNPENWYGLTPADFSAKVPRRTS